MVGRGYKKEPRVRVELTTYSSSGKAYETVALPTELSGLVYRMK